MYARQVLYPLRYNTGFHLSKVYHKRTWAHNTCVVCVFSAQNRKRKVAGGHLTSPGADSTNDKRPKDASLSTELSRDPWNLKQKKKLWILSLLLLLSVACFEQDYSRTGQPMRRTSLSNLIW